MIMQKLFSILITFALVFGFSGCEQPTDNEEQPETTTTLRITNQSSYGLLSVTYSTVEFGDLSAGKDTVKEVAADSKPVYFNLKIFNADVNCKTNDIISCEEGEATEQAITNNTSVTAVDSGKSGTLSSVYGALTEMYSEPLLQLSQDSTVIANNAALPFDFGSVVVGTNKPLMFTIKNAGNVPLQLTGDPVIQSSNNVFTIPTQPTKKAINPEDTVSFLVQYNPTEEKADAATITILNNTADMVFTLNIKGNGAVNKPQITVNQVNTAIPPHGNYDFADVAIGAQKDIIFTIGNSGDANLTFETIDGKTINPQDNTSGFFSVTYDVLAGASVAPGKTTTFTVRFKPEAAGTDFSATLKIKTNSRDNNEFVFAVNGKGILAPPAGAAAGIQPENSILLSWNPVQGAESYKIYYGTSALTIETLLIDSVTETSYTHTGLSADITYYYNIAARNGANESARSNTVSQLTYPGIPGSIRSTFSTQNSIKLTWEAVTGGARYKVYYAATVDGNKILISEILASGRYSFNFTHDGLQANTTYYYFVSAVNATGEGVHSEALEARTLLAPLSAPTNITATALSTNSIQVTWGSVSGAASYKVYRAASSTGTKTLLDTVTTTSYTNGGLEGQTYFYFVTAVNTDNIESSYSTSASMIPKPGIPGNVGAYGGVSWSSASGAEYYKVYRSTSLTGIKILDGTLDSGDYYDYGEYRYTFNGEANTTYYFWVTAVNDAGESDYSLHTSCLTPPAAPDLWVTSKTTTTITIAWNAVAGAASYYADGDVYPTPLTGTALMITGLYPQTVYTFNVCAVNSAGDQGPSTTIYAMTN